MLLLIRNTDTCTGQPGPRTIMGRGPTNEGGVATSDNQQKYAFLTPYPDQTKKLVVQALKAYEKDSHTAPKGAFPK